MAQTLTRQVVFSARDDDGVVEVVDEGPLRTLHFGTPARQSTMFRRRPWVLALSYTHYMVLPLLLVPSVRRVLVLGLGGGSLPKFLLRALPDCQIEAVEKRALVIGVARDYFALADDPRLQVWHGRAEAWPGAATAAFDLILVDLHDQSGLVEAVGTPGFLAGCKARLTPGGALAVNLWAGARRDVLDRADALLRRTFAHRVLQLPVAGKQNTVALAFNGRGPLALSPPVRRRAAAMEAGLEVPFGALLQVLAGQQRGVAAPEAARP